MTTDDLDNALAFAAADQHDGDLRVCFTQAKTACRTLAAEVERLRAELTDAREQLLSEGWCPDADDPTLAQLCARVATAESEARRHRDEAYDRERRLRATVGRLSLTADRVPIAQVRGEQVWRPAGPEGMPQSSRSFRFGLAVFRGAAHDEMRLIGDCYSTREAAEEARKR